jgi:hypothetical protein
MAVKNTVIGYRPHSSAAVEIKRLAHILTGREFEAKKSSGFGRMWKWLFG